MRPPTFRARPGANLIEVLVAASAAALVVLALGGYIAGTFKANRLEGDRAYAMQKALQLMEEVAAHPSKGPTDPGPDRFADGPRFVLTTEAETKPHGPLSGNPYVGGYYKYVRQITSEAVPGDPNARRVTVRIWYNPKSTSPVVPDEKPLVALANVFRSNVAAVDPKHVIDVYVLSIENLPHVMLSGTDRQYFPSATAARTAFGAAVAAIEAKNPYLELRLHYITRLSEGRDKAYRPYVNEARGVDGGSERDPLDWVYFYPGRLGPATAPDSPKYYDPAALQGAFLRGDATPTRANDANYALADQFNHAVRYPEEFTFAAARDIFGSAPAIPPGGTPTAADYSPLSLRQFLETLLADRTGAYRNALLVNLNGELFPAPPLRNYADPAKDPADPDPDTAKRRLVTHPYKLVTPAGEPVRLLVHPFLADGADTPSVTGDDRFVAVDTTTFPAYGREAKVVVKGLGPVLADAAGAPSTDVNDVTVTIVQRERQNAGVGQGDKVVYKRYVVWPLANEPRTGAASKHSGPHATAAHGGGADPRWVNADDLEIHLTDLDYDARAVEYSGAKYGVKANSGTTDLDYVPHRLQYFPDPYLPFLDLATGEKDPRNTARVIVEFRVVASAAPAKLAVETHLKTAAGWPDAAATPPSPAISRAWLYLGAAWDAVKQLYWAAGEPTIPWTEQVQLVGDPRHNPYLDVRQRGLYNPYFSDFRTGKSLYFKDELSNDLGDPSKCLDQRNPLIPATDLLPPAVGTAYDASFPGTADSWSGIKYDVPAYFRIWREALVRHDMVLVNPTGMALRFLGQGGEFALAKKVDDVGDVKVSKKPYDGSASDAGPAADELFDDRTAFIERQDAAKWYAKPWLGELYPPGFGAAWLANGNLPTGTGAGAFWRVPIDQLDDYAYATDRARTGAKKEVGETAFAAFLNATTLAETSPVDWAVGGGGDRAPLTTTGKQVADALRMALHGSFKTPYAFKLSGGTTPPGWAEPRHAAERGLVDWLDAMASPPPYYAHKTADEHAVAPIALSAGATDDRRAVIVASGLVPDGLGQVPAIWDVAVTAMVAAYHDGCRHALGAHNVKVLPRIKVMAPQKGASLGGDAAEIKWYTKWVKPDGKPYSPLFTEAQTYPLDPASGEPHDVKYYVKYRQLPGGAWMTAKLASPARASVATTAGAPEPGVAALANAPTYPDPIVVIWDTAGLPNGDYLVRVEGFRDLGAAPPAGGNHAYHELPVTIAH